MATETVIRGVYLGGRLRPDLNGVIECQFDTPDERAGGLIQGLHQTFHLTAETAAKLPAMGEAVDIVIRSRK